MLDWLRRLPPNVQGALWLVSGGFIFTSTSAMIRLLSTQIESVQTAFFRAVISVILLLPMIAAGRVKPWQSQAHRQPLLAHRHGHRLDGAGLLCRVDAAAGRRHGHRLLPAPVLGRRGRPDRGREGALAALERHRRSASSACW